MRINEDFLDDEYSVQMGTEDVYTGSKPEDAFQYRFVFCTQNGFAPADYTTYEQIGDLVEAFFVKYD